MLIAERNTTNRSDVVLIIVYLRNSLNIWIKQGKTYDDDITLFYWRWDEYGNIKSLGTEIYQFDYTLIKIVVYGTS